MSEAKVQIQTQNSVTFLVTAQYFQDKKKNIHQTFMSNDEQIKK